jgi:hypothetical protein
MIQAVYGSTVQCYTTTEEYRINTAVTTAKLRYLCKLTSEMSKAVKYVYGLTQAVYDRYTYFTWNHTTTADSAANTLVGNVNLVPNGYWKYEIYEVSWVGSPTLTTDTAPISETQTLPVADANGIVQGRVELGKLYVAEKVGEEQVQYTQRTRPEESNYIYYGQ